MVEPDSVNEEGTVVPSNVAGATETKDEVATEKVLDDKKETKEVNDRGKEVEKSSEKDIKDEAKGQDEKLKVEIQSSEQESDGEKVKNVNELSETVGKEEVADVAMQDKADENEIAEIEEKKIKNESNKRSEKTGVEESGKVHEKEGEKENEKDSEKENEEESEKENMDESGKESEKEVDDEENGKDHEEEDNEKDKESERDHEKFENQKRKKTSERGQKGSLRKKDVPGKGDKIEMIQATKVKKRKRSEGRRVSKEPSTPAPPMTDRPVRERKSVERLVASIERGPSEGFVIGKGQGTALKDIPNVSYKLAKRKNEEIVKALHPIFYGRRGKASECRANVFKFSGFVWHENEEKQRAKIKEKLDKLVKPKLLDFCDVLDVPISKAAARKEDVVAKLVDFMAAPHATTDVILKEQSRNSRKRKQMSNTSASRNLSSSTKKRRISEDSLKVKKSTFDSDSEEDKEDENVNGKPGDDIELSDQSESEKAINTDDEDQTADSGHSEDNRKRSISKGGSAGKGKTRKADAPKKAFPQKSSSKKSSTKQVKEEKSSSKSTPRKKKEDIAPKKKPASSPKLSQEKSGTKGGRARSKSKKGEPKPSADELRQAICDILKEVDFNTATFTDILKHLASKFDMDLMPRKAEIKGIIQEELTKLADAASEGEEDGSADKDEKVDASDEGGDSE